MFLKWKRPTSRMQTHLCAESGFQLPDSSYVQPAPDLRHVRMTVGRKTDELARGVRQVSVPVADAGAHILVELHFQP